MRNLGGSMRLIKFLSILTFLVGVWPVFGQSIFEERIRKIPAHKRSVYFEDGIFHNGATGSSSKLNSIRQHFSKKLGYERIVFDFSGNNVPKIYMNLNRKESKLYLDLFKTVMSNKLGSFGNSQMVKGINVFPFKDQTLSLELDFKKKVSIDVFTLENPNRLVIDVKP